MVDARLLHPPVFVVRRRACPASTLAGSRATRSRSPAGPARTEEIIAVMRCAADDLHAERVRALIVILWRARLRIQEALSLTDLQPAARLRARAPWQGRPPARDRHGRLGLRARPSVAGRSPRDPDRPVVLRHRRPQARAPVVSRRCPRGAGCAQSAPVFAGGLHRTSCATHAIELAREGVPLNVIQRQLGHLNLGVTSIYLQGIDPGEIIETIHARRPPMIPASAGLDLRRR